MPAHTSTSTSNKAPVAPHVGPCLYSAAACYVNICCVYSCQIMASESRSGPEPPTSSQPVVHKNLNLTLKGGYNDLDPKHYYVWCTDKREPACSICFNLCSWDNEDDICSESHCDICCHQCQCPGNGWLWRCCTAPCFLVLALPIFPCWLVSKINPECNAMCPFYAQDPPQHRSVPRKE